MVCIRLPVDDIQFGDKLPQAFRNRTLHQLLAQKDHTEGDLTQRPTLPNQKVADD